VAARSLVQDYGCPEQDVCVVPPGIDLDLFRPGARQNALPRILFVGGDFPRKGGDVLLRAFQTRLRGRAVLELVTSGDVPAQEGVRVHRGVQANSPELRALYSECDVFTLPTRADCLPLVCLEALASGLPVVATPVGGIPDLVRQDQTGRLVPVGDADALADALDALVSDIGLRQALGRNARAFAEQHVDARVTSRKLFEFVRSRV
jgi:glycosyltransferase involved in cell wall biosynthesis